MSSFWWNFHHWLHWKLSFWQLSVQPVMKISSKWRHFRFSVSLPNMTWHYTRQCNGLGMTQIRYCSQKRHHIPRPHGRAICGCPLSLLFDQVYEFFPMKKLDFKFLEEINSLTYFLNYKQRHIISKTSPSLFLIPECGAWEMWLSTRWRLGRCDCHFKCVITKHV